MRQRQRRRVRYRRRQLGFRGAVCASGEAAPAETASAAGALPVAARPRPRSTRFLLGQRVLRTVLRHDVPGPARGAGPGTSPDQPVICLIWLSALLKALAGLLPLVSTLVSSVVIAFWIWVS